MMSRSFGSAAPSGKISEVAMTDSQAAQAVDVFPFFHLNGLDTPVRGPDGLTVTERPYQRALVYGVTLSRTLWRSEAFRSHADAVRISAEPRGAAWDHAGHYATGGSQGRCVTAGLLFIAATVAPDDALTILQLFWMRPIVGRSDPSAKKHPVTARTLDVAERRSELIARRGAGLCIVPACSEPRTTTLVTRGDQYYAASGPVYCAAHALQTRRHPSDRKAIEHTFATVAAAWPTLEDRELLRWWWAQRGQQPF